MELHAVIEQAQSGSFSPVYLIVGSERFLADRAVNALREHVVDKGTESFNTDLLQGNALTASKVIAMAKTVPMMSRARLILVRNVDDMESDELEAFGSYLNEPCTSTCLVMTAEKLDGRSKFARTAKDKGFWVDVEPLKAHAMKPFAIGEAKRLGHPLSSNAADALVDCIGTDLSALDDALERLSLYVGEKKPIDEAAIQACIARIRVDTIWTLVDAVGLRNAKRALESLESLLEDREPPLRILAMVARQLRIVARMREALGSGLRGQDAARQAGAPPFKAQELTESARRFTHASLAKAFKTLAEADQAMKGSKTPPEAVLEAAVLQMTVQ